MFRAFEVHLKALILEDHVKWRLGADKEMSLFRLPRATVIYNKTMISVCSRRLWKGKQSLHYHWYSKD